MSIATKFRALLSRSKPQHSEPQDREDPKRIVRSIRTTEEGPRNCPRCGSRIQKFGAVYFEERSPAPIEEGFRMLGVVPGIRLEPKDDGVEVRTPDRCIIASLSGGDDDVFVCIGLRDRAEVEMFLAQDFPGGKVPSGVTEKAPCGWTGKQNDYRIKWM